MRQPLTTALKPRKHLRVKYHNCPCMIIILFTTSTHFISTINASYPRSRITNFYTTHGSHELIRFNLNQHYLFQCIFSVTEQNLRSGYMLVMLFYLILPCYASIVNGRRQVVFFKHNIKAGTQLLYSLCLSTYLHLASFIILINLCVKFRFNI